MKQTKFNWSVIVITMMTFILLPLSVSAQKKKVSCVGNSITYGYSLSNPSTQSYPGQLQTLLGTTNWEVGKYGDSGRTMLKAGGYSYWDSQSYKDALVSSPDFVIIELGTNDSKRWLWDSHSQEFKTDYKEMIKSFQDLPSKPEILIGLLIPGEKTDWDIFNSYIKDKVNPKIKEVALELGLGLIDLYTELNKNKHEWYLSDSVHPSVAGAGVIAGKVKEILVMPKPEIVFANGKVTAPEGSEYQWYIDGIPVTSENYGQHRELTITKSGLYKVSVKLSADNETRIISKEMYVSEPTSSRPAIEKNKITVYPNPASGFIYVQADRPGSVYTVTDIAGKIVLSGQLPNGNGEINIEKLSIGSYLLVIGRQYTKVIKTA